MSEFFDHCGEHHDHLHPHTETNETNETNETKETKVARLTRRLAALTPMPIADAISSFRSRLPDRVNALVDSVVDEAHLERVTATVRRQVEQARGAVLRLRALEGAAPVPLIPRSWRRKANDASDVNDATETSQANEVNEVNGVHEVHEATKAASASDKENVSTEEVVRGKLARVSQRLASPLLAELRNLSGRLVSLGETARASGIASLQATAHSLQSAGHAVWSAAVSKTGPLHVEAALNKARSAAITFREASEAAVKEATSRVAAAAAVVPNTTTSTTESIKAHVRSVHTKVYTKTDNFIAAHPTIATTAATAHGIASSVPLLGSYYLTAFDLLSRVVIPERQEEQIDQKESQEDNQKKQQDQVETIHSVIQNNSNQHSFNNSNSVESSSDDSIDLDHVVAEEASVPLQPATAITAIAALASAKTAATPPPSSLVSRGKNGKNKKGNRVQIVESPKNDDEGYGLDDSILNVSVGELLDRD